VVVFVTFLDSAARIWGARSACVAERATCLPDPSSACEQYATRLHSTRCSRPVDYLAAVRILTRVVVHLEDREILVVVVPDETIQRRDTKRVHDAPTYSTRSSGLPSSRGGRRPDT